MKQFLKTVAKTFFQDYELYKVYRSPILRQPPAQSIRSDVYEISSASDEGFAAAPATFQYLSSYFGSESIVTGLCVGRELATVAVFWYGDRYKTEVGFLPLGDAEVFLAEIRTDEKFRGRGLAVDLIQASGQVLALRGFRRLYALIWHSNKSSQRAFQKAGWMETGFVAGIRTANARWRRISYPFGLLSSLPD